MAACDEIVCMNLLKRVSYKYSAQVTRDEIYETNICGSSECKEKETGMQVWENVG
jgi:hypothetical protein